MYSNVDTIPTLPDSLNSLNCGQNNLTHLPLLPSKLQILECSDNMITDLPELPPFLVELYCNGNELHCIPHLSDSVEVLYYGGNYINCIPNYPMNLTTIYPAFLGYCLPGNSNFCEVYNNIRGRVYSDSINNCQEDLVENPMEHIKVDLYNGSTLECSSLTFDGNWGVYRPLGTYTVVVDTIDKPYIPSCMYPGIDTTVVINVSDSVATDLDFGLICKPGFDAGVWAILRDSFAFFPGLTTSINIHAGDYSDFFSDLNCADGQSLQLNVTVTGPITYTGVNTPAITPDLIVGNTYTYNIADLANINFETAFKLNFETDTSANLGDSVQVTAVILTGPGDNNSTNDSMYFQFKVVNSYDPNSKEVSPFTDVLYPFEDWLTYTIYFQNTGTAPAVNVRLVDTLDIDLDISTFELLAESHDMYSTIYDRRVEFHFDDIWLVDSSQSQSASIGYVQYRMKPDGLHPVGDVFNNTAYIYFDYNTAIITNTTQTTIVEACEHSSTPMLMVTPSVFCEGDSVLLNISGNLNDDTLWTWYSGSCDGVAVGTGNTLSVLVNGSTTYYADGIGETNCIELMDPTCGMIQLNPLSNSYFTQSPTICDGNTFIVGTHTYNISGTFVDTLVNSGGCDSVIITQLTVIDCNGIDPEVLDNITLYPNPTNGIIYIQALVGMKQCPIEIVDLLGHTIICTIVDVYPSQAYPIDISIFDPGIYVIRMGNSYHRIIKE